MHGKLNNSKQPSSPGFTNRERQMATRHSGAIASLSYTLLNGLVLGCLLLFNCNVATKQKQKQKQKQNL